MGVLNLKKVKKKVMYAKGGNQEYWYKLTFEHLGDEWLFDTLNRLIKCHVLPQNFTFASLSANVGLYEKKAYDELSKLGYNVEFYLGDKEKIENHIESYDKFFYELVEEDAAKVILPNNRKVDIILDSKGALWYAIKKRDDLINLLKNYHTLLKNDNSILLIDRHNPSYKNLISEFTKNKGKLLHFAELSNYTKLNSILKCVGLNNIGTYADLTQNNPNKLLTKYLKTHYYTKKEIEKIIKELENTSRFKYQLYSLKVTTFSILCYLQ